MFYFSYSIYECEKAGRFKWVMELGRSLAAFLHIDAQVRGAAGWAVQQKLCQGSHGFVLPLLSDFLLHPAFNPVSVWEISSLWEVYYRFVLATMCVITVSMIWPYFCWVSVIAMISFPTLSISVSIFQQKPFFTPFSLFSPFLKCEEWLALWPASLATRMLCSITNTHCWQRVTSDPHCVTSPSGSDSHTWGREEAWGWDGLGSRSGWCKWEDIWIRISHMWDGWSERGALSWRNPGLMSVPVGKGGNWTIKK